MKNISTYFLRFMSFVFGLGVLALCIFALPSIWKGGSIEFPEASLAIYFIVIGLYVTAIPFFFGLWQVYKLLGYIDKDSIFSELSLGALRKIKYSAGVIALLYVGGVPLLLPIAEADDAPGLILIGMGIALIPVTVTVFSMILEKLLKQVVQMKFGSRK